MIDRSSKQCERRLKPKTCHPGIWASGILLLRLRLMQSWRKAHHTLTGSEFLKKGLLLYMI